MSKAKGKQRDDAALLPPAAGGEAPPTLSQDGVSPDFVSLPETTRDRPEAHYKCTRSTSSRASLTTDRLWRSRIF